MTGRAFAIGELVTRVLVTALLVVCIALAAAVLGYQIALHELDAAGCLSLAAPPILRAEAAMMGPCPSSERSPKGR